MIEYANLSLRKDTSIENVGDWVQIFAIDNIYRQMGVPDEEVVRIGENELSSYRGDKVILPLNFPIVGIYDLSPDIYPVYLGVSMINGIAGEGLRMKLFAPVGCRDHHTYEELKRYEIEAYHGGCLTITLPKRKRAPKEGKIYISGVSNDIYQFIPLEIREKSKRMEHVAFGKVDNSRDYAKQLYDNYKKTASLVITSKIHCAQPCLAMGIPVVFICEENSFRYDVVSHYIKINTVEDLCNGDVDWNPQPVNVEGLKQLLIKNAERRIREARDAFFCGKEKGEATPSHIKEIDSFFSPSGHYHHSVDMVWAFQKYIKERYKENEEFEYGVWGITQFAYSICEWMEKRYPKAKLGIVIDTKKTSEFFHVVPVGMEGMRDCPFPIFMTVPSMTGRAKEVFKDYNVKKYVVNFNGLWIEDGTVLKSDGILQYGTP